MRYEGTRPSKNDPAVDVFRFTIGLEEMQLMRAVVTHYYKSMPDLMQVQPTRQRLKEIRNSLDKGLEYHRLSKYNIGNAEEDSDLGQPERIPTEQRTQGIAEGEAQAVL